MPKPKPKRTCSVNARRVPIVTRDAFKAWCARRGYTMEDTLIALMQRAVTQDKPIPEARKN